MKLIDAHKRYLREAQLAHANLAKLRSELSSLTANQDLLQAENRRIATLTDVQTASAKLDLARAEVKRLDSDLEVVKKRIDRDQTLLVSTSSPKDIAGLEHELVSLRERQDLLETQELEALEQMDGLNRQIAELESDLARCQIEIGELEATRNERAADLSHQIEETQRNRDAALSELPQELSELLQQLWSRGSGVGQLHDTTCGVCHMGLNSSAMQDIKRTPEDELVQCPECRAILIRPGGE